MMLPVRLRALLRAGITALCLLPLARTAPVAAQAAEPGDDCVVRLIAPYLSGPADDIARLVDLQDSTARTSWVLRRAGQPYEVRACMASPVLESLARSLGTPARTSMFEVLPASILVVGNSAYPRDWNDGVLWGGRGLNTALSGGVSFRVGPLSGALAPVLAWQSNSDFDMQADTGTSQLRFRHPFYGTSIDAPQRFGADAFSRVDPGQSYVRLDAGPFGAGISTQNIRWGPARRNPVVLSGTAPGFPHAFIEMSRPVDIWIGDLEAQLFWGRLEESEYFDDDPDNDHRMLAGLLIAFQPHVFDGLVIGFGRMESFTWWPDLSLSEVLLRPYKGLSENPQGRELGDNQLISAFFRWSDAPWGMDVYGEWAREDHWGDLAGLFRNPDSSQGFTIGLQKLVSTGDNLLRIATEVTHLADALPGLYAGRPGHIKFYTNSSVPQGHTHLGQYLGAPIGTGAESQWLGVDLFWNAGRTSLSVERARYESEAYMEQYAPVLGATGRDVEVSIRGGHLAAAGPFAAHVEIGWSLRRNRMLLGLDDFAAGGLQRRDNNWQLRAVMRWTPHRESAR